MDPFNLAICFGPSLCPIPDNKDLVQHTNLVNDLIKNFIQTLKDPPGEFSLELGDDQQNLPITNI